MCDLCSACLIIQQGNSGQFIYVHQLNVIICRPDYRVSYEELNCHLILQYDITFHFCSLSYNFVLQPKRKLRDNVLKFV